VLVMGELNEWAGRQYFGVVMATMTSKAGNDLRHRHPLMIPSPNCSQTVLAHGTMISMLGLLD
jgi:hypothetical protein